jgi:YebC/PmpR family DNA-binding regulatory protein
VGLGIGRAENVYIYIRVVFFLKARVVVKNFMRICIFLAVFLIKRCIFAEFFSTISTFFNYNQFFYIMGRAFEYRKARKMKRWGAMAKAFTRIGKEIAMAVKEGGGDVSTNARLRMAVANSKGVNMPKDKVDAAIKRATSKDEKNYEIVIYEGYGPFGIPMVVETATDNTTRTVANVRMHFNKNGGTLGNMGSVAFMFERKGVFKLGTEVVLDDVEMDLIDCGAEDIAVEDEEIVVYTAYDDFGAMLKGLEERNIEVVSAELQFIPNMTKEVSDAEMEKLEKLIDALEDDDDVNVVYHGIAM